MEIIIDKELFLIMKKWSLEDAPISNEALLFQVNKLMKAISEDSFLDEENYQKELNKRIADYLYSNYSSLILTEDEKIIGISKDTRTELFDATDRKPHSDIG